MFKKLGAVSAALLCAPAVFAGTTSTSFNVTASVVSSCNVSASDLEFGSYDPLSSSDKTGTTNVSVQCSLEAPYDVGLSTGGFGSGVNARQMQISGGTEKLDYALYQDAAHELNWGNTVDDDTLANVGTGLAQSIPVYGVIPALQNVPVGDYSDSITVTVTY